MRSWQWNRTRECVKLHLDCSPLSLRGSRTLVCPAPFEVPTTEHGKNCMHKKPEHITSNLAVVKSPFLFELPVFIYIFYQSGNGKTVWFGFLRTDRQMRLLYRTGLGKQSIEVPFGYCAFSILIPIWNKVRYAVPILYVSKVSKGNSLYLFKLCIMFLSDRLYSFLSIWGVQKIDRSLCNFCLFR